PAHFDVTTTELKVPGLDPAHDGLVIAQLSDLHIGPRTPDGRVIAAVRAVNAKKPDVVFLTGDYVTWRDDPIEHIPLVLAGIEAKVFASLGNHDHFTDAPRIRGEIEK